MVLDGGQGLQSLTLFLFSSLSQRLSQTGIKCLCKLVPGCVLIIQISSCQAKQRRSVVCQCPGQQQQRVLWQWQRRWKPPHEGPTAAAVAAWQALTKVDVAAAAGLGVGGTAASSAMALAAFLVVPGVSVTGKGHDRQAVLWHRGSGRG